jgi:serine/threonine protein kinase
VALSAGTRLGPYEILERLGAGGMGEVYRARDTKLGREVAVKVLPEDLARDEGRVARFEREARVLASLNHPHIATLHGFEQEADIRFLVMELVEGEDLATRLKRSPLPLREALRLFLQVAKGLEAAHEKGVIHRDLKPANMEVTQEGTVKILDFGLAKAILPTSAIARGDLSQSPTQSATHHGEIMGTAAYMSPEQAQGRTLDKRTDIWAFGCCLYEALTGKAAFLGETVSDTIASVLRQEPDWRRLPDTTPRPVRGLLGRCLRKDANERLHDIADARIEIEDALSEPPEAAPSAIPPTTLPRWWWRLAPWALAALAVGVAFWSWCRTPTPASSTTKRAVIPLPENVPLALAESAPLGIGRRSLALSPDGSQLAYVANRDGVPQLYLRPMDGFASTAIPGTEGAFHPFFSPDGTWVGFFTSTELKKVSVLGGDPVTLCEARNTLGGSWAPDGKVYFSQAFGSGLYRVPAEGGRPAEIASRQELYSYSWPEALPPGDTVLVSRTGVGIVAVSEGIAEEITVIKKGHHARYASTGHLIYARGGGLMAVPFDVDRQEVTGTPIPLLDDLRTESMGAAQFSFSLEGSLIYASGSSMAEGTLVMVDRQGKVESLGFPMARWGTFRFAPEGRRVAIVVPGVTWDIWLYDLARRTQTRLTFEGNNGSPVWSPDGKWLAFTSDRTGSRNIFRRLADGSGETEQLTTSQNSQHLADWSADGKWLVFVEYSVDTSYDIWALPTDEPRTPKPLVQTPFRESLMRVSPDGRWLAYTSDASGQFEVYVRPLAGPGGTFQISGDGGEEPVWSPKGDKLFYSEGQRLMVVSTTTEPDFSAEKPELLFELNYINLPGHSYDIAPDGRRFLFVKAKVQPATTQLMLVVNWFEELKRVVPTN